MPERPALRPLFRRHPVAVPMSPPAPSRRLAILAAAAVLAAALPAGGREGLARSFVSEGDCEQVAAFVPVPASRARSVVPDGFAIVGEEAGTAFILVTGGVCDPWSIDGQATAPFTFGLVSVLAHPRGDPPSAAGFDLWWLVDEPLSGRRLRRAGFFARQVPVTYQSTRTPLGTAIDATVTVPWRESPFSIDAVIAEGPLPGVDFLSQHWYESARGRSRSDHVNTGGQLQPAMITITAAAGSPLAELLGAEVTRIAGGYLEFHHLAVWGIERSAPPGRRR